MISPFRSDARRGLLAGCLTGTLLLPASALAGSAEVENHMGSAVAAQLNGDFTAASASFEAALKAAKDFNPGDPRLGDIFHGLAVAKRSAGKLKDAEPYFKLALLVREQGLGRTHLDVAATLTEFAEFHRMRGQSSEAVEAAKRSLSIREAALGAEHMAVAASQGQLANIFMDGGDYQAAVGHAERALDLPKSY